jgi:cyclic pyranopterin phosphate synthase
MEDQQEIKTGNILTDKFGRSHSYLRLSLTDRCNLRCSYCMPAYPVFLPHKNLLTSGEIYTIASTFKKLGVTRIRLTGGEPLVRPEFDNIASRISSLQLPLHLTTNGYYVDEHIEILAAHFKSVNISLDTLKKERFEAMTSRKGFERTLQNIELVLKNKIPLKINVVVINGVNDDELPDFIKLTLKYPLEVRFIEFMPFRGNQWNTEKTFSRANILQRIESIYRIESYGQLPMQTTEDFRVKDAPGSFGIISTVSKPFCEHCNRLRITAEGKLKNCLFGLDEFNLKPYLNHEEDLLLAIETAVKAKHASYGGLDPMFDGKATAQYSLNRTMTSIGG